MRVLAFLLLAGLNFGATQSAHPPARLAIAATLRPTLLMPSCGRCWGAWSPVEGNGHYFFGSCAGGSDDAVALDESPSNVDNEGLNAEGLISGFVDEYGCYDCNSFNSCHGDTQYNGDCSQWHDACPGGESLLAVHPDAVAPMLTRAAVSGSAQDVRFWTSIGENISVDEEAGVIQQRNCKGKLVVQVVIDAATRAALRAAPISSTY